MPWTGQTFRERHNHGLTSEQAAHAARIANAILQRSGNERIAIATANKLVHRDEGGGIAPPYEVTTSPKQASPGYQNMVQQYANLSPERLQELSVMLRGSPQAEVINRVLQSKRVLPAETQKAKGGRVEKRAAGGLMSASEAEPWWTRTEAYQLNKPGIFLHGATPGRADMVHTTAPGGSHIIPADVISGMGQGNSLAGAARMEKMLRSGPYGSAPAPMRSHGMGIPRAPAPAHFAKGGSGNRTPVALSDGEMMIFPHWVAHFGGGDPKKGKKKLNDFIVSERKKHIKQLQKLPGPVREGT